MSALPDIALHGTAVTLPRAEPGLSTVGGSSGHARCHRVALIPPRLHYTMQVVLFAVPGAFTPTCSLKHLPGFIEKADMLKVRDNLSCYGTPCALMYCPSFA